MFQRIHFQTLTKRLAEPRLFIQVLVGPRQVGKTTLVGQLLSYNKMLGQLQDAGNTTTLAHYLDLLDSAGLLCGLEKYAGNRLRQRLSSPKFQVHNTALIAATHP